MIWRSASLLGTPRLYISSTRSFQTSIRLSADALRDELIQARFVRVIDPETGSISPNAQRTERLLQQIDRTRYWLVQVKSSKYDTDYKENGSSKAEGNVQGGAGPSSSASGGGDSKSGKNRPPPRKEKRSEIQRREEIENKLPLEDLAIVKLIDKKEAYNKQKALKLEKKQNSSSVSSGSASKQVEMSWSSTSNDVQHKLKVLLTHLQKKGPGAKAMVLIKAKKGKGRDGGMNEGEKKELLTKIEDYLCKWEEELDSEGTAIAKPPFHARRVGEVEWKGGQSQATVRFEVFKSPNK
jgi:hypothetical protein